MKKIALAALCLTITGCATIPVQTEFQKSRVYSVTKDEAWERLIRYFAENSIPIKTIEKVSGIIYAERVSAVSQMDFREHFEYKKIANCGSPGLLAMTLGHITDMNVFVRDLPGGSTSVTVNVRAHELRKVVSGGGWTTDRETVDCLSTGALEQQVLDAIGTREDGNSAPTTYKPPVVAIPVEVAPLPVTPSEAAIALAKKGQCENARSLAGKTGDMKLFHKVDDICALNRGSN